jgi:hypothetical protein
MGLFLGEFATKEDIVSLFSIADLTTLDSVTVIYAAYYTSYNSVEMGDDGEVYVLYAEGDKVFEVHRFHGPWEGLKGQWIPVQIGASNLKTRISQSSELQKYEDSLLSAVQGILGGDGCQKS